MNKIQQSVLQYTLLSLLILFSVTGVAKQREVITYEAIANDEFLSSVLQVSGGVSIEQLIQQVQTNPIPIPKSKPNKTLLVTATAYTSHRGQTDSTPNIAAWGDRLRPGMKAIAVSRDLLTHYQLKRGTLVKIHGLPGEYRVLDKMNKRWRKKIDIYMGLNKRQALNWGKRKVVIEW